MSESHTSNSAAADNVSRIKTLALISLFLCVFHLTLFSKSPAQDGDSFEYAGVARSILRYGEMRETLLRSYTIKDQPLPHPSAIRANLYSISLVPFYLLFRDTQWTFLIPTFIGLFLLPLVVYRTGLKFFDEKTAFYASVLSMFTPSLLRLYTLMDPGLPEVWQMIFYLLFLSAMIDEKYIIAGILMALAYLFKNNSMVLIPSALIWLYTVKRKHFFGLPLLKIFLTALIIVLPFLIRNYIVFHSPTYNEQFAGISRVYGGMMIDRFAHGDLFGVIFNYDAYNIHELAKNISFTTKAANFMRVLWINVKLVTVGGRTGIFYIPGVPQIMGLALIPFFIIGLIELRKRPAVKLLSTVIFLQILLHTMMAIYSDRYLLCIIPLIYLIGVFGIFRAAEWFSDQFVQVPSRKIVASIIAFIIISESSGFIIFNLTRFLSPRSDSVMAELETTCGYLNRHTKPDDVIMTYPFFSTHFVCNRPTVPLPYGDVKSMASVIKKYNVKNLIFASVWTGDLFPELPFTSTVVRGKKISLFKISTGRLSDFLQHPRSNYLHGMNPVSYFLSDRFSFEVAPPLYKTLSTIFNSLLFGAVAYLALFVFFLVGSLRKEAKSRYVATGLLIIITSGACLLDLGRLLKPYLSANPQISRIETRYLLRSINQFGGKPIAIIGDDTVSELISNDFKSLHRDVTIVHAAPVRLDSDKVYFVPVRALRTGIYDEYTFARNEEIQKARSEEVSKLVKQFENDGFHTQPVYGGIFVYARPSSP
ncbi:MAG TPA: glycosyltransferase family 39 protein [bacterium]|nr:glycosyltransferase family 39 protein [bacterium]